MKHIALCGALGSFAGALLRLRAKTAASARPLAAGN